MRKLIFSFAIIALSIVACQNNSDEVSPTQEVTTIDMSDFYVFTDDELSSKDANGKNIERCYSMKMLNKNLKANPGLYDKMYAIEKHTRKSIAAKKPTNPGGGNGGGGGGGTPTPYVGAITIPVIVNILENSTGQVTQNQIDSQISVLNTDYNNNNPNTGNAPAEFAGLVANVDITFTLAGVNRMVTSQTNWLIDDTMKHASQGGIDATDTSTYLNLWVVNGISSSRGIVLGYAQFPGGSSDTDGVVIGRPYFGITSGNYGGGRTATHEVGHWLNLRHIWGDGQCNRDDFVSDTPSSNRANYGCPSYPTVHCRSNDMTMNYMDYTYDNCMYMFTDGQNDRMRTLFGNGGFRESFVQ